MDWAKLTVGLVSAVVGMGAVMLALPPDLRLWVSPALIPEPSSPPASAVADDSTPTRGPVLPAEVLIGRRVDPTVGSRATPAEVASGREPVILRDWSAVSGLAAIREWTVDNLREKLDGGGWALRRVRGQFSSPVFRLSKGAAVSQEEDGEQDGDNDLPPEAEDMKIYNGVPFGEFVDHAYSDDVPYLYYTVPLDDWRVTGLADAAKGWEALRVEDKEIERLLNQSSSESLSSFPSNSSSVAMVWMSQPGVTAHAHYDRSHNFLVQILGRKRVLLWPPSAQTNMYPYPHTHPQYHQSQVEFEAPDRVLFPDFDAPGLPSAAATELYLEPGDTLYIPPFWWHRIETVAFGEETRAGSPPRDPIGLSLSVVSPSAEEARLAAAYWTPLPFGDSAVPDDGPARSIAVQTFLVHLLSRLESAPGFRGSPRAFARNLRLSRFPDSLGVNLGLGALRTQAKTDCLRHDPEAAAQVRDRLPKKKIIDAARAIAKLVDMEELSASGILEVWLGDYAEELARWAVRDSEGESFDPQDTSGATQQAIAAFLSNCLNFDALPAHALVDPAEEVEGPPVIKIGDAGGKKKKKGKRKKAKPRKV